MREADLKRWIRSWTWRDVPSEVAGMPSKDVFLYGLMHVNEAALAHIDARPPGLFDVARRDIHGPDGAPGSSAPVSVSAPRPPTAPIATPLA